MTSPVCTHCTEVIRELLRDRRPLTYSEVVAYPQSCHFCANLCDEVLPDLAASYSLTDVKYFISERSSPGSYHLTVDYEGSHMKPGRNGQIMGIQAFLIEPESAHHVNSTTCDLESDTISQSSLEFLRSKLEQCVASHSRCSRQGTAQRIFVPTRLLEVQGEDPSRVKLVDTKPDISLPYCTLSHCWGSVDLRKLTRDSERALRTGVLVKELPKTFKEAVEVCRELNVPYLWIDSLCIFQDTDDLADWHAQSATMGDIYLSARVNIAASSAEDSTVGLRFNRNTLATVPFTFTASNELQPSDVWSNGRQGPKFVVTPSQFAKEVEYSLLSHRGWVLQERFLSPRIIHFSSVGVFWECMTSLCSDIFPDRLPEREKDFEKDPLRLKKLLLDHTNANLLVPQCPWDDELYYSWSDLVSYYSECQLSFETDRLIAINGIAQRLAQVTGDFFICGLWKQHLIPQLLWYRWDFHRKPKSLKWFAPTWSWASHVGDQYFPNHLPCRNGRELVTVEKLSVEKRPSGQIIQAALVLRGRTLHARLDEGISVSKTLLICEPSGDRRDGLSVLMDEGKIPPWKETVLCMAIYEDTCEFGLKTPSDFDRNLGPANLGVLIFKRCRPDSNTYRRIGIMLLHGEQSEFYKSNESLNEYSIELE